MKKPPVGAMFSCRAFTGFGPHRLLGDAEPASFRVHAQGPAEFRRQLCEQCPRQPGVYGMLDVNHELIYVGKATSLRARLLSYFRPRSRARKAFRVAVRTRGIVWEHAADGFAALLRELELIQRFRPRLNVLGQPSRFRRVYLCLTSGLAPGIFLKRRPPSEGHTFGPFMDSPHIRQAVAALNDTFLLRDCPTSTRMIFAEPDGRDTPQLAAACMRHDLGACLGPCAALCTESAYRQQVHAARSFLDGSDLSLLERLERDMTAAGRALAFERATILRDRLEAVRRLSQRLHRLRHIQQTHSFIYTVAAHDGGNTWYVIREGRVLAAIAEPTTAKAKSEVTRTIRRDYSAPLPAPTPEELSAIYLVAAWFRRKPEERDGAIDVERLLRRGA